MEHPLVKRYYYLYDWTVDGVEVVVLYDVMHQCEEVLTKAEWQLRAMPIIRLERFPYYEKG